MVPEVIGVVGAGTMGAGIAQLACRAGARTLLHDADESTLAHALVEIRRGLERDVERGRLDPAGAQAALRRLAAAPQLAELAPAGLVIEAAPESLELKRELFHHLAEVVGEGCVLATNTSSLSVTALAAGIPRPERVVGMHFFNPAPMMKLVEVVAGDASSDDALQIARATGAAMGKHVIEAADAPGFLVNRCNRPFALEGLRLVQERLATPEQVDRICRLGGGFPMGPFELMDLVGVDVGFEVSRSFYEQSFGEPRWQPSPLAARMAAAGRHGRKTGRGWFDYPPDGGSHRPEDPPAPSPCGGDGRLVVIAGDSALAGELVAAAEQAGWRAAGPEEAEGELPELVVDCGADEESAPLQGGPPVLLCDGASLAALDPGGSAAGFFALPPLGSLIELTHSPSTSSAAARAAEEFFSSLGRRVEWVGDAPGLVLGRIVSQLVNEAAFALGEGLGSASDIDAGMVFGLNHPRGPLEWGDEIGTPEVLAVLAGLQDEYREERYRPAPALLRAARNGEQLHARSYD